MRTATGRSTGGGSFGTSAATGLSTGAGAGADRSGGIIRSRAPAANPFPFPVLGC